MPSKVRICKLSGHQAKIALLHLLECTYNTPSGALWSHKLDEALIIAESYPAKEEKAHSSTG